MSISLKLVCLAGVSALAICAPGLGWAAERVPPQAAGSPPSDHDDDDGAGKRLSSPQAPARQAPARQAPARQADDDDDDEDNQPLTEVVVTARRLDAARASIEPSLGASSYALSNDAVESRPGGESADLVHVLLQMPGVVQGASGELRVRAQGDLQYRINNVIVPDGFTDLADTLRARFADKVELVTGALPAQYGLQVGGVVNITTKSGVYEHGGEVELYGGAQDHFEPAFEVAGSAGQTNFYVSGSYMRDANGLASLDGSADPLHDRTGQVDGFVYLDHIIDPQSRLSVIAGTSDDRYQLPHARGLDAATYQGAGGFVRPLRYQGLASYPSERWGGGESDDSQYGIVSYQRTQEALTVQLSAFARYSTLALAPDVIGDVLYTGVSQAISNRDAAAGIQAEAVYSLATAHTLRAGLLSTWRRERSSAHYTALPVDAQGRQTSEAPLELFARSVDAHVANSLFVQDEWRAADDLTFNFGLRFDDVAGQGGGRELSPRVNAVWTPTADTTVHAGYARYFVPAPGEAAAGWPAVLAATTGAAASAAESPVRAEIDDYYDLGAQQRLGRLTVGLDAYWRAAGNLLDAVRIGSTALTRPFNFDTGRVRGVELNLTYDAGPLSTWANLGAARAEGRGIISGQAPFSAATLAWLRSHFTPVDADQRYTGSAGAAYQWRALHLSADAVYGSGPPRTQAGGAPNGARLPSYLQVNLSAVYRVKGLRGRRLDLRVDVANAFNRRYRLQDGSSLAGGAPQWGQPQSVLVGAEQAF